jgi:hypothetical protein
LLKTVLSDALTLGSAVDQCFGDGLLVTKGQSHFPNTNHCQG